MKRTKTLGTLLISLLFAAAPLFAAGARQGWTKVELSAVDGRSAIESAGLLQKFGGELIADYGAYAIIYVPKGIVTALEAQAGKQNLRVRVRDELDVLQLPGAALDAREGISGVALNKLAREYRAGQKAVYVVQFTAPLRAEWMDGLRTIGWELSRYIPNDGYLLVGTPELVEKTRKLGYVQWLDAFHPYQKAFQRSAGGGADAYVFALPPGNASEPVVDEIRRHAPDGVEVERGSLDTYVFGRVTAAAAEELLQNELILSATLAGTSELSDERQVHTLSTLLNPAQTQPIQGDYWNWVLSRCPDCSSMPAATWKIGISDSGVDNGAQFGGHPDLAGRKFYGVLGYDTTMFANESQCPAGQLLCDAYRHGTLVAGMAAGNGATGIRDSGNYLMGLGGAPTAGIFATKMFTATDGHSFDNANLFKWTKDAANNNVTIQNHSWQNDSFNGKYTDLSRRIDIAARDADDSDSPARKQLLMTFAAGNDFGQTGQKTSPAGMAKNVLTVGGLENYRPEANQFLCSDGVSGHFTRADSFFNIMSASRVGTNLPGYVKPDVMAPASMIVSTQTSIFQPDPAPGSYCLTNYEGQIQYSGHSGTSFSAPLGAAAALIVKRYLGSTPDATSPALTKAVLIAGTRSVRGGEDRTKLPAQTIGEIPSQQQGFGRLTLEDILNGSQKPVVFDQSPARTFTASGQTFSTTVRVRDASKPVKIALVWTDAPATAFATNPLVNDLNLEVRRSSDSSLVHIGNKLTVAAEARGEESIAFPAGSLPYDNVNNVEYFRLFVNPNEDLTITVKAWNIAGDTNGVAGAEQDFALAILNAGPACVPGVITQQPLSQTIIPGQTVTASVGVTGTGPFNYQWYQAPSGQFVNPVGIGQVSYTSFPLSQSTQYWAHVTDTCVGAFLNSNAAVITVQCTAPPAITTQPVGSTINPGQSVTLSVGASQAQSYQWYSGTSPGTLAPIAGATAPTLTVSPASTLLYSVRVSNGCGVANSNTVTICVLPAITAQPTSRTINPGQSTTLTVSANNATTYQWYVGVVPSVVTPIGGNSSSLTVTPATTTSYWVRVSNACGLVNSTTATVTVAPVPPAGITRIQSNFALANSQNSITAGWPQPTQAGTFLVAVISADKDSNPVINWTAPAGWIQANTYEWNHDKASVYYLPNNAGGRTSETFTVSPGFHDQTLYLLEYSGVLASGALDRTAINGDFTNNGYLQTGFTPNTTQAKELVITVLSTYAVTSFSTTPADGYTEVYDKTIGYHLTTAIYEKIATSIASYGHGANVGVSDEWVGLVVTFKAAVP